MSIRFADISEFQDTFDANGYLAAGTEVIICRVYNGYRNDNKMPGRMAQIRSTPFVLVGWYLYLAAGVDPVEQARSFVGVVGQLRANEFAIVDHEEGAGNQIPRCAAALQVCDEWSGQRTTLYSGASYLDDNLGGPEHWTRPLWIASYLASGQADERLYPKGATFWQYTDKARFTGLSGPVDGSYFRGSAHELAQVVRGGPAGPVTPPAAKVQQSMAVAPQKDHELEVFTQAADGTVWHRWVKDGRWQDWSSLGKP